MEKTGSFEPFKCKAENLAHMLESAKRKPQIWHGNFLGVNFWSNDFFQVLLVAQRNILDLEFCSHSIISVLKS